MEHLGVHMNSFRNTCAFQDQMLHEPEVYLRMPKRKICVFTQRLYDEHNRYHDADCD